MVAFGRFETDSNEYNLDLYCPRCGNLERAILEAGPIFMSSASFDHLAFLICRCPKKYCAVFFVEYDILNRCIRRVYPYPDSSSSNFHESIPEKIREDIAEAKRCYFTDASKAVVVMCRRVLQQIASHFNAKGDNLKEQINDMFKNGLITKSLNDTAHEIRFFGNFGAHPQKDNLDNVSSDEANSVWKLTNSFLLDLYIRPFDTKKLTQKRKSLSK